MDFIVVLPPLIVINISIILLDTLLIIALVMMKLWAVLRSDLRPIADVESGELDEEC